MRVLVTGGAGYMGSMLARYLLGRGDQVRVLDTLAHGGAPLLALFGRDGFEFIRGDVCSAEAVAGAIEGADAVVHLAAIVGDPACARDPALARQVNQDASLRLYELCQGRGVRRFVFASTCSNYGKMRDPSGYVMESSELRPLSVYAETKVAVERHLLDGGIQRACVPTVLRFATLFGLSPRPRFDLTVNEFTAELLVNKRLAVFGAQFWRPYIHVRDAARAVVAVLQAPVERVAGEVYNVGDTSQNYRKQDIVDMVRAEVGTANDVRFVHRQEDPRDYRVSFEKVQRELGFRTTRTVPEGVREIAGALRHGIIEDYRDPRYRN